MNHKVRRLCEEAAVLFGCEPEDFMGSSVGTLLGDCSKQAGVVVYWGCWTREELDQIIPFDDGYDHGGGVRRNACAHVVRQGDVVPDCEAMAEQGEVRP